MDKVKYEETETDLEKDKDWVRTENVCSRGSNKKPSDQGEKYR